MDVLFQASVADRRKAEQAFNDANAVFDPRPCCVFCAVARTRVLIDSALVAIAAPVGAGLGAAVPYPWQDLVHLAEKRSPSPISNTWMQDQIGHLSQKSFR
jgi:hypothetical protein